MADITLQPRARTRKTQITAERLREVVAYNSESGNFTAKLPFGRHKVGDAVGTINIRGYVVFAVDGVSLFAHRAAWLYMTGEMPALHVDHENQNRADNRFANLRLATNSENLFNRGRNRNNKSGFKGVSFWKKGRKWRATITVNRRQRALGYFATAEEAHRAYAAACQEVAKEFAST